MKQNQQTKRWQVAQAVLGGLALTSLGACSFAAQASGELGQDQRTLSACPDERMASYLSVDVTGSGWGDDEIVEGRKAVIANLTRQTAICGGHLRVMAFTSSSAATVTLYDGELNLPGATDIARLRRVPGIVEEVTGEIAAAYDAVVTAPPPEGGSDIVAQYRLAHEYADQLGPGYTLELLILTDGFQTTRTGVIDHALTPTEASDLAATVALPELPGASVTVAGLGEVAGDPPTSDVVDGLVSFYDAICARTGAETCLSVTDYAPSGW